MVTGCKDHPLEGVESAPTGRSQRRQIVRPFRSCNGLSVRTPGQRLQLLSLPLSDRSHRPTHIPLDGFTERRRSQRTDVVVVAIGLGNMLSRSKRQSDSFFFANRRSAINNLLQTHVRLAELINRSNHQQLITLVDVDEVDLGGKLLPVNRVLGRGVPVQLQ